CLAFESYGKKQSYNAPVSQEAAFRYGTALNELLNGPNRERHRLYLADGTVLFWTGKPSPLEAELAAFLSGNTDASAEDEGKSQDDATLGNIRVVLRALREGSGVLSVLGEDPETPFYVLGLSPNAGRISVRIWHRDTLGGFVERLRRHYEALDIVRPSFGKEFPTIRMLLRETALQGKDENVAPLLGGALMRSILTGAPYPDTLATAIIRRIRADHDDKQHPNRQINYLRAAILKAWLLRSPRWHGEIPVSLDTNRPEPAYRLGRLFAALEKTQEEALPGINATIRDRYYGAVSATPGSVVPRLLRTYQHHLSNLSPGGKVTREKLVQEIVGGIGDIPRTLSLEEQGLFAIGYYHQRQNFFTPKGEDSPDTFS
ncbi:MAG: type I-C CRISPR-associated protein Cas8c/Csd1, partial [Magnetococcales bacterium]|nr:type I-C CRISPR-associated protein Cas8c/Csd1 [Magnetococcales bacterium]